jgi:hypothetical protein
MIVPHGSRCSLPLNHRGCVYIVHEARLQCLAVRITTVPWFKICQMMYNMEYQTLCKTKMGGLTTVILCSTNSGRCEEGKIFPNDLTWPFPSSLPHGPLPISYRYRKCQTFADVARHLRFDWRRMAAYSLWLDLHAKSAAIAAEARKIALFVQRLWILGCSICLLGINR